MKVTQRLSIVLTLVCFLWACPPPPVTTDPGDTVEPGPTSGDTADDSDDNIDEDADNGTLPAFPGAEGFGATATGGRGGQVLYVTNLNPDGEGSFQWACDQPGPRYILFRVSGVLDDSVHLSHGDVTIAAQTSPGGILVRGFVTDETPFIDSTIATNGGVQPTATVSNFIIRYLHSRPAFDEPTASNFLEEDALRIRRSARGIVDHCSLANAYDETVEISMSHDITVQNCLLAENIGDNALYGGLLIQFTDPDGGYELNRLSIHHNTWNRIISRTPAVGGIYARAAWAMQLEVANNLLWDTAFPMEPNPIAFPDGPAIYYQLNWVGNYGYQRAAAPEPGGGYTFGGIDSQFLDAAPTQNSTYFHDNRINLYPDLADYQLVYCCNDYPTVVASGVANLPYPDNAAPGPFARGTRHSFPEITYIPSAEVRQYMLDNVGAFPRDPMDRRLLTPLETGTIEPAARNVNPAHDMFDVDYSADAAPAPPLDTDKDGMPDDWEAAHGLDLGTQDHNGTELSVTLTGVAGYTNLECYLNELAEQRIRE